MYYLQEKLLFHPVPLPPDYQFKFNMPFQEVNIPLNSKDNLNIVRFLTPDPIPKGVVLYFHGNRDNINRYAKYAVNFTKNGYEVWITDYPGYGKTTGKLTEENLYLQAKEVYKLARSKPPFARTSAKRASSFQDNPPAGSSTGGEYLVRPPGGMPSGLLLSSASGNSSNCEGIYYEGTGASAWGYVQALGSNEPAWSDTVQPSVSFPVGGSHTQPLNFSYTCSPPSCGAESRFAVE